MAISSKTIQVLIKKMWKLSWSKSDRQAQQALDDGSGDNTNNIPAHTDYSHNQDIVHLGTAGSGPAIADDSGAGGKAANMVGISPVAIASAPQQARTWSGGNGTSAYTPTSPLSSSQHSSLRPFTKTGPSSFTSLAANPITSGALFLQPCAAPPHPSNSLPGRGPMKRKDSFVSTISRSIDTTGAASAAGMSAVSADGRIDFLTCLPYEIAMVVVLYADFPAVTTIAQVSRAWRRFAQDNAVWRRLFLQQQEWRTPRALASAG
ncbi:hypothetical protein EV175_007035, partial [Coemansia sp. RSA 1933]